MIEGILATLGIVASLSLAIGMVASRLTGFYTTGALLGESG